MIIGIGIDIIEIHRLQEAIDRWGSHFLNHVFTKEEIDYAQGRKFPIQHFAARFAAKEAVFKAFGNNPDITWKDIVIMNDKHGKPFCKINKMNFPSQILLSISHTKNYAVANAIILQS